MGSPAAECGSRAAVLGAEGPLATSQVVLVLVLGARLHVRHAVCLLLEDVREVFISGPRTRRSFSCESGFFLSCGQCESFLLWPPGSSAQSQSFVPALVWSALWVLTLPSGPAFFPSPSISLLPGFLHLLAFHCVPWLSLGQ